MALDKDAEGQVRAIFAELLGSDEAKKTFKDVLRPVVVGVLQSELKPLGERLDALGGKVEGLEKAPPPDPSKKGGAKGAESEEAEKLRSELQQLQKRDEAREREREQERTAAKRARVRASFFEAAQSVEGGMLGLPQAYAFLSERLVEESEGKVVVEVKRDGYTEKLPLKDFLSKDFRSSEEGKLHFPAKQGGGGAQPGGSTYEIPKGMDRHQAVSELLSKAGIGHTS